MGEPMSSRLFMTIFMVLHVALVGGAYLMLVYY